MAIRLIAACLLFSMSCLQPGAAWGAEGIPDWSRTLEEVLSRAEAEVEAATRRPLGDGLPKPADMPEVKNVEHPSVGAFVRFYTSAGAHTWRDASRRLASIRGMVEEIFAEEGVPTELLWLGVVESGYRPDARSPKGAYGVWQFMPETARRFGVSVNERVDERADTRKATRAAARYLSFLYETFGDWNLAVAAYNAGEGRVQSAIDRSGVRDFWLLAEQGQLPRETIAYVPAVLAAQRIGAGPPHPMVLSHGREPRTQVVKAPFSLSP